MGFQVTSPGFAGGTVASAITAPAFTLSGTGGAGFLEATAQSSNPAAPAGGFRFFADSLGRLSWRRASDGFARTFDAALTADRVFTLPDAAFTFAGIDINQTWAGSPTFSNGITLGASGKLFGGTNTVEQRNGTSAQSLRLYNTYTDASNYERGSVGFTSNIFTIQTSNLGTGAARGIDIIAQNLRFGGSNSLNWNVNVSGHFLALSDNTYDVGASGASRPRSGYFGTSVVAPKVNLSATLTPTSSADSQGSTGDVRYDDNYVYVKTSTGWKRAALATF